MMRIDDATLMAYADGELDEAARAKVEAAIAADPALQARVAAHRELRATVAGAFAGVIDEPVPDRLAAMLQPGAEVVDFAAARERREARPAPRPWRQWAAIAATLVVGVLAGRTIEFGSPAIIARDGEFVAQGKLAEALDTDLASAGGMVGLSFRNRAGDYCRTFSADGIAGVACRDSGGWGVRTAVTAAPGAAGDYRMAGSETPPEVLRSVESMIDGEPLDAAAEAAARVRGWRD